MKSWMRYYIDKVNIVPKLSDADPEVLIYGKAFPCNNYERIGLYHSLYLERLSSDEPMCNMKFKFSGHETFPCRYAWLPKAFRLLENDPHAFVDEVQAMVDLGIGKNMFRALRFWLQATGVAESGEGRSLNITDFGHALLSSHDPYLEDRRSLWLLHWKIATHSTEPLFAWYHLLNVWNHPEMSRTQVLPDFEKYALESTGRVLSPITLIQHYDMFIRSYVPTHHTKDTVLEDTLDCPLVELELVQPIGDRAAADTNRREVIYAFHRDEKPDITAQLFAYALYEFWCKHAAKEQTLGLRDITFAPDSPGQVFKLSEWDIRQRLHALGEGHDQRFTYKETAAFQLVTRGDTFTQNQEQEFLAAIYQ